MSKKIKIIIILLVITGTGLSLLTVLSYLFSEPSVSAKVTGGNPPVFALSGGDETRSLLIYVCCNENAKSYADENIVWEIEYPGRARKADELGQITYGVVPDGFYQRIPDKGQSPPPLIPNQRYAYLVRGYFTLDAGNFEIRNGKAVEVQTVSRNE